MVKALHSTLAILNPVGVKIVLETMQRTYGVDCSAEPYPSKERIGQALIDVLGQEAGKVVIREWNKKITSKLRD